MKLTYEIKFVETAETTEVTLTNCTLEELETVVKLGFLDAMKEIMNQESINKIKDTVEVKILSRE